MANNKRLQITITVGDLNENKKADVTVEVAATMPVLGSHTLTFGPFDLPVEQTLSAGQAAAGLLPPPASGVVAVILGLVKAFLT